MIDFVAVAFAKSVRAISDLDVRMTETGLQLGFGTRRGFVPSAFDGLSAVLDVATDEGQRTIRGTLQSLRTAVPCVGWSKYRFVPENPVDLFFILDRDFGCWTNVKSISFVSSHGTFSLSNRQCFEPFACVPI